MIGTGQKTTLTPGGGFPPVRIKRKRRLPPLLVGPLVVALVVALIAVGIKAAYGGFSHRYALVVDLPRAGQNLGVGSDVRERGVVIGRVGSMRLVDRHVELTLQIDPSYQVPASSVAVVDLKTLLGAKFVDLRFPSYGAPFLQSGDRVQTGQVGPEFEDVLADGVNVLDAIRPGDLATVIGTLAQGAQGHGADIARSLQANAALNQLFAHTLEPQLRSLHDLVTIFGALKSKGVDLNALADAVNQGVPVYASAHAQAELTKALDAVTPFANNLADLLILNRPQWDKLMNSGDVVLGAIAARPGGLHDLVKGLGRYVFKLSGTPYEPAYLKGSGAAGFVNFIGGDNFTKTKQMICAALPIPIRGQVPLCTGGV